jgi:hypothetical protein
MKQALKLCGEIQIDRYLIRWKHKFLDNIKKYLGRIGRDGLVWIRIGTSEGML